MRLDQPLLSRRAASVLAAAIAASSRVPPGLSAEPLEFITAGPPDFQYADAKIGTGAPPALQPRGDVRWG